MSYKLTKEDKEVIMDKISDIHDVIKKIKGRLEELYDDIGEICDIVKCAEEVEGNK